MVKRPDKNRPTSLRPATTKGAHVGDAPSVREEPREERKAIALKRKTLEKIGAEVSLRPAPEVPVERRTGKTTQIKMNVHGGAPRTFAAIDLGSSSAKLLVQRQNADGTMQTLVDVKISARLGENVRNGEPIPPENEQRAVDALKEFLAEAARHGVDAADIPLITTAVVRNASDGAQFLARIKDELGIRQARILSGDDEANIGFRGGIAMMNGAPGAYATLDLGGGSFQLAVGDETTLEKGGSTQVGSNVILDTLLAPGAQPDGRGDAAIFAKVDAWLESEAQLPLDPSLLTGRTLVATGGVSKFLRAHFERDVITRDEIEALRRDVIALPYDARVALVQRDKDALTQKALGVDSERGAIDFGKKLPASASLLLHILDKIGVNELRVSETDARHFLINKQRTEAEE